MFSNRSTQDHEMLRRREQNPNKIQRRSHSGSENRRKQGSFAKTDNREYKHTTLARPGLAEEIANWATRKQKHDYYPSDKSRPTKDGRRLSTNDLLKNNHTIKI